MFRLRLNKKKPVEINQPVLTIYKQNQFSGTDNPFGEKRGRKTTALYMTKLLPRKYVII